MLGHTSLQTTTIYAQAEKRFVRRKLAGYFGKLQQAVNGVHEPGSAAVTLNLYDAQNNLVGNTAAVGQHIAPGQRWIYRAYATLRYAHAAVSNVTAYHQASIGQTVPPTQ
ncbi:FxLYD domain-containing protein [Paraburkholderia tropica]|uniref:FxLYD domain-containing protein n=1 Tax=Paraburkholderia tropica TaxID=92647 RepID=UPI002AB682EC|nr:FxLYD domain-containing protein [Paraburkholderia tropica]